MSRRDRLRRVVILCCNFAVHLAYYRVGQRPEHEIFGNARNAEANFWRTASNNFIDICVLEWCKLFAERKGKHCWLHVVADPVNFRGKLLQHLGLDGTAFEREVEAMRHYRNKFLAHLDSEHRMSIPSLEIAKEAVWFYLDYVVQNEVTPGDLAGLPVVLDPGYAQCEAEARKIYDRNKQIPKRTAPTV
jgi:hypothetical protein